MFSDGAQSSLVKSSRRALSWVNPTVVQSASEKLTPLVAVRRSSPEIASRFAVFRLLPIPTARMWLPAAFRRSASCTALFTSAVLVEPPLPPRLLPWPFTPLPLL